MASGHAFTISDLSEAGTLKPRSSLEPLSLASLHLLALDTVCHPRAFSWSYGGSVYKGNLGSDGSLKVGVFKSTFAVVRHRAV